MIKPDVYTNCGKIIDCILQSGFVISKMKMSRFTVATAGEFYKEHKGKPFYQDLVNFMTSDVVIGMELIAENAVLRWR